MTWNTELRTKLIGLVVLSTVLLAGCSGVLSGGDTGPSTPTPSPTDTETGTPTPEPTETPTETTQERATEIPVPSHLDYDSFAAQIGETLNEYRGEQWVQETSGSPEERALSLTVEKPPEWAVQDAEFTVARELARASILATRASADEARDTDVFLRPDEYRVTVTSARGKDLSTVTVDADLATSYADSDISMAQFAARLAETRVVHTDTDALGNEGSEYYLRRAEYRPLQRVHLQRIGNESLTNDPVPEIRRAEILPEKETLYYEIVPPRVNYTYIQEPMVTRTYLEAIKEVHEDRRINRFPRQMVLFINLSYSREESVLTTAKTNWAFDYFVLTDWELPQDITLSERAIDAYINRIVENRKLIEADDDYDYVAEARDK